MEKPREYNSDSDRILVNKCQQGDDEAYRIIIYKYQQVMLNLLFRLTNDYDASQDLAQEVFIKAFRGIGSFKGNAAFSTWLYRIAINVGINYNRSKRKKAKLFVRRSDWDLENQQEYTRWGETPESLLENMELSNHIEKALGALSEEHRAIIILRDIDGISYEQIAEVFNCPLGTVRSRLSRARQALKVKLKSYL